MSTPKIEIFCRKFKRNGSDFWIKVDGAPSFDSIEQMFSEVRPYLQRLSEAERTNLFYSQGLTTRNEEKKEVSEKLYKNSRLYHKQNMLLIDIDHIIKEREKELIDFLLQILGLSREKTAVISTGYGIQLVILFDNYFVADKIIKKYFMKKCEWIESKMRDSGFMGELTNADRSVADSNKLARLGDTLNSKPGRDTRESFFITDKVYPQFDSATTFLNIPVESKEESKKEDIIMEAVDTEAVLKGCNFIKEMLLIPKNIHEPEVRVAASILKFLDDGVNKAEDYFKDVRSKGDSKTISKLPDKEITTRVLGLKFHRCDTIKAMDPRNLCHGCPHFGKIAGPLNIQSENFAVERAKESGFRKKVKKRWIIDNLSLLKHLETTVGYFISDENQPKKVLYRWDGRVFKALLPSFILKFCYDNVNPEPTETERNEFLSVAALHNMKNMNDLFHTNTEGKINFQNGVLNIESGELMSHSPDSGFTYYLHCDYNPEASAPEFQKVLREWLPSQDSVETYQMYGGDILAGGKSRAHKVLILTGNGRNGKSAAGEIIDEMLGGSKSDSASIAMNAEDFGKSHMMAELQTKSLVIIDEQRPNLPAGFWENLKRLSAGGKITADKKFRDANTFNNRARFMIIVNQLSSGTAHTEGFLSRLLIVNFPRFFAPTERDPYLVERLIQNEAAGIANWFIDGFRKLRVLNFQFPESGDIKKALEEYQEETNMIYAFCKEKGVELGDPGETGFATGELELHKIDGKVRGVWTDKLYDHFFEFVKLQFHMEAFKNKWVEGKIAFSRKLNQRFNQKLRIKVTLKGGKNTKVFEGLRVRGYDASCSEEMA